MFPRLVTADSGLLPLEDLVGRLDPVVPLFEDAGGALVAEAEARVGAVGVAHRDHRPAGLEAGADGEVGGGAAEGVRLNRDSRRDAEAQRRESLEA